METIEVQQIATNRYAPEGANAVRLYATNGAEGLTLGQLVAAVCIHRGAHLEARAVGRMNRMTQNNAYLEAMSSVCSQLAAGTTMNVAANIPDSYELRKASPGCSILEFLQIECGLSISAPTWSYDVQMTIIGQLKAEMDKANTTSQEDVIELQSMINWRDVTYNASSGIIARYGNSGMNMAGNI